MVRDAGNLLEVGPQRAAVREMTSHASAQPQDSLHLAVVVVPAREPGIKKVGKPLPHLRARQPIHFTDIQLDKAGLDLDLTVLSSGDRRCCLDRATEWAGVHRIQSQFPQMGRQSGRLKPPSLIQRGVCAALHNPVSIVIGLTVSNEEDFHAPSLASELLLTGLDAISRPRPLSALANIRRVRSIESPASISRQARTWSGRPVAELSD